MATAVGGFLVSVYGYVASSVILRTIIINGHVHELQHAFRPRRRAARG